MMMKRRLSALLTLAMLMSMVTVNVFAEETEWTAYDENIILLTEESEEVPEDEDTQEIAEEEISEVSEESAEPETLLIDESSDPGINDDSDDIQDPVQLDAPKVTASNVASTGKIKLTWTAVNGAKEYVVYRATSKDGNYKEIFTTKGRVLTNTSVTAGKTYYYKVKAVAEDSTINDSVSSVVARTCDLERPVVTATNVKETGKIQLTWKAVSGAIKYKVYRADSKNGDYSFIKTVNGTKFTNISVEPGKKYYYKVRAIANNSSANSAYSTVDERTCDLAQPQIQAVANSKGKPRITWEAIPGAIKYKIYRSTSKSGTYECIYTASGTSFTNSSASVGKTYYYKVRAIAKNENANSAYSDTDKCIVVQTKYKYLYSSYSTPIYNFSNPNYAVACAYVDGTIVAPGEEFSLNRVIGPRWSSRGYGEATVIKDGVLSTGVGGGVCQVATTLFNAALYANFDITDREQHSLTSAYVAVGRDAMMFKDSSDFRFINTSDYYIKISAKATNGRVTIKFYTREKGVSPADDVSIKVFKTGSREYFTVRRYKGEPNYYTKTYYD